MMSKSVRVFPLHGASIFRTRAVAFFKNESQRRAASYTLIFGVVFAAWCAPADADNPPTSAGNGFPAVKPASTTAYVKTSDNKLLLDGADNISSVDGETNYPGKLELERNSKLHKDEPTFRALKRNDTPT
jgi:hypothetical protein